MDGSASETHRSPPETPGSAATVYDLEAGRRTSHFNTL